MNGSNSRSTTAHSVELFVRSLAPSGATDRQTAAIDELERLKSEEIIESYTVTVWGNRICPETARATTTGQTVLDKIDQFRQWGREEGISLEPYFQRREIRSMVDEPHSAIVPPMMCLAVYDDDDLWGVFPCVKEDEQCSIFDYLQSIEENATVPGSPSEVRPAKLTTGGRTQSEP